MNLVSQALYLFRLFFIARCEMKTDEYFHVQLTPALWIHTLHRFLVVNAVMENGFDWLIQSTYSCAHLTDTKLYPGPKCITV